MGKRKAHAAVTIYLLKFDHIGWRRYCYVHMPCDAMRCFALLCSVCMCIDCLSLKQQEMLFLTLDAATSRNEQTSRCRAY